MAATPTAPGEARDRVCSIAQGWLAGEALETARLLVSELVTNTVRHGDCDLTDEIDVHVTPEERAVRIEICQRAPVQGADVVQRHPDQEGGWGLALVETLSEEWGVQPEPPCVWFKLAA